MVRFMESLLLLVILFVEMNEAFLGGGHGKRESLTESKKFFEESKVFILFYGQPIFSYYCIFCGK